AEYAEYDCSGDVVFFFSSRSRHTRFSRDWSSDVCSSDLRKRLPVSHRLFSILRKINLKIATVLSSYLIMTTSPSSSPFKTSTSEIGRASCRERVTVTVVAA